MLWNRQNSGDVTNNFEYNEVFLCFSLYFRIQVAIYEIKNAIIVF